MDVVDAFIIFLELVYRDIMVREQLNLLAVNGDQNMKW